MPSSIFAMLLAYFSFVFLVIFLVVIMPHWLIFSFYSLIVAFPEFELAFID